MCLATGSNNPSQLCAAQLVLWILQSSSMLDRNSSSSQTCNAPASALRMCHLVLLTLSLPWLSWIRHSLCRFCNFALFRLQARIRVSPNAAPCTSSASRKLHLQTAHLLGLNVALQGLRLEASPLPDENSEQFSTFDRLVGTQIHMSNMNMLLSFRSGMTSPADRFCRCDMFFMSMTS